MTVALVGQTAWATTKTWPTGSAAGHVGVLVGAPALGWAPPTVPGWSFQGWAWTEYGFLFLVVGVPVYSRTLTAADVAVAPPSLMGQVVVFSGSPRVSAATGGGQVTAPANGGAVAVAASFSPISGGSVTWLTEVVTPETVRARVGWKAAGSSPEVVTGSSVGRPLMLALSAPDAPLAPVIVSPVSGEVSSAVPADFVWVHRPTIQGGSQSHYALAVTTATYGTRWWTGSGWAGSETWVASSAEGVSVPAASLVANAVHSWTVRTRESLDGRNSPPSQSGSFTPVSPPSMTLTGPASPVVDDLSPTVTWTSSTPRGAQTAFRVWWSDPAGVVVADSGVTAGSDVSWTAPSSTAWVRGAVYAVRGQVWQTGGSASPVVMASVTVTWTPPATPSVIALPGPVGVSVHVGGVSAGAPVLLQRLLASGDWVDALEVSSAASAGFTVRDVFAEYGAPVRWRARQSATLEGVGMVSDWGESAPVVSEDRGAYLADAVDPLRTWVPVVVSEDSERVERQNRVVSWGKGDRFPTVWSEPQQGLTGSVKFAAVTADDVRDLYDLVSAARTLVFREHPEDDDGDVVVQPVTRWVAPSGSWSAERAVQVPVTARMVPFEWVEQPVVGLGSSFAPVTSPVIWD